MNIREEKSSCIEPNNVNFVMSYDSEFKVPRAKKNNRNTRVSQNFCNILVTCRTIWQYRILLPRLWRLLTLHDCEMPYSPDTLRVLHTELASMALIPAAEAMLLDLPDLALIVELHTTRAKFLQPSSFWIVINCTFPFRLTNVFGWFRRV